MTKKKKKKAAPRKPRAPTIYPRKLTQRDLLEWRNMNRELVGRGEKGRFELYKREGFWIIRDLFRKKTDDEYCVSMFKNEGSLECYWISSKQLKQELTQLRERDNCFQHAPNDFSLDELERAASIMDDLS